MSVCLCLSLWFSGLNTRLMDVAIRSHLLYRHQRGAKHCRCIFFLVNWSLFGVRINTLQIDYNSSNETIKVCLCISCLFCPLLPQCKGEENKVISTRMTNVWVGGGGGKELLMLIMSCLKSLRMLNDELDLFYFIFICIHINGCFIFQYLMLVSLSLYVSKCGKVQGAQTL